MPAIAYYFLQVVLCSGLMMGYYLLVLRNKRFHQYNRFYLLTAAIMSWLVPLIKIKWTHPVVTDDTDVYQLLYIVAHNNSKIEKTVYTGFQWSGYTIGAILYVLVAVVFLTAMVMALYKVYRLLKFNSYKHVDDVYLILTREEGTPFSFFRYIFWNEEIDIRSESGKQILEHEIAHVRQKHSIDKVFIQVMLIPGWFNPFFWLLKKELEMIHEFIADKKAVNNGDSASLAQMLLTAAFPQQNFALTNPFFFSPIRRRLKMLTDNSNPRFSYLRRAIVLPLLAVVVMLFSFRAKEEISVSNVVRKVISVVDYPMPNTGSDVSNLSVGSGSTDVDTAIADSRTPLTLALKKPLDLQLLSGVTDSSNYGEKKQEIRTINIRPTAGDTSNPPIGTFALVNIKRNNFPDTIVFAESDKRPKPLIVIDGKRMRKGYSLDTLNPNNIDAISVKKSADAIAQYGDEATDGVLEITTKDHGQNNKLTEVTVVGRQTPKSITVTGYAIRQMQPSFPGGTTAWNKYLERNQDKDIMKKNGAPAGHYAVIVGFYVSEDGSVSDIHIENDPGYGAKEEAIKLISKGPKWVPLERDGKNVYSFVHRTISFVVE